MAVETTELIADEEEEEAIVALLVILELIDATRDRLEEMYEEEWLDELASRGEELEGAAEDVVQDEEPGEDTIEDEGPGMPVEDVLHEEAGEDAIGLEGLGNDAIEDGKLEDSSEDDKLEKGAEDVVKLIDGATVDGDCEDGLLLAMLA